MNLFEEAPTIKETPIDPIREKRVLAIRYVHSHSVTDFDFFYEGAYVALDKDAQPHNPFIREQAKRYRKYSQIGYDATAQSSTWHKLLREKEVPLEKLLEAVDRRGEWILLR